MSEKFCDSTLLDKAIIFATTKHKNTERRGYGFPYIIHPLEVVSIVSLLTNDQNLLAAAALHDVVEDTDTSIEDIEKEFGKKVAEIVNAESDVKFPNLSKTDSWKVRKEIAINRLANTSHESKIVAMGDKLSNMRAIYRDYLLVGDKVFDKFHVKDKSLHEWHYRGLAASLSDLKDTYPYKEFVYLIDRVYGPAIKDFSINLEKDHLFFKGIINKEDSLKIEEYLDINQFYYFDFSNVTGISIGAVRRLISLKQKGYKFIVVNVTGEIEQKFFETGANNYIQICNYPTEFDISKSEKSGEGFTANTYTNNDNETIVKVYEDFIKPEVIQKEKIYAQAVMNVGIATPMCGELVKVGNKNGILFEKIDNKVSFAKALAMYPDHINDFAKQVATMAKQLHHKHADRKIFPDIIDLSIDRVNKCVLFNDMEKKKVLNFLNNIDRKHTYLHGDFHIGNLIFTTDTRDSFFIDLGDVCYGDPLFDLGTLYYVCHTNNEKLVMCLYHCDCKTLLKFWELFVGYYFDDTSKTFLEEFDKKVQPFAALKVVHFANMHVPSNWMRPCIEKWLLSNID